MVFKNLFYAKSLLNRTLQTGRIINIGMLLCVVCTLCNKKRLYVVSKIRRFAERRYFQYDINIVFSRIRRIVSICHTKLKTRPSIICWAADRQKIDMAEYTQWISFTIHYGKLDSIYLPTIFFIFADFCDFFQLISHYSRSEELSKIGPASVCSSHRYTIIARTMQTQAGQKLPRIFGI